jgi:hypothetical protein
MCWACRTESVSGVCCRCLLCLNKDPELVYTELIRAVVEGSVNQTRCGVMIAVLYKCSGLGLYLSGNAQCAAVIIALNSLDVY